MGSIFSKSVNNQHLNKNKIKQKLQKNVIDIPDIIQKSIQKLIPDIIQEQPEENEFRYCYVCKLEKKIILNCINCNKNHSSKDYYKYHEKNKNKIFNINTFTKNLVCHKCFYLYSENI